MPTQALLGQLGQADGGVALLVIPSPRRITGDLGDSRGGASAFLTPPKTFYGSLGDASGGGATLTRFAIAQALDGFLGPDSPYQQVAGVELGTINLLQKLSGSLGQSGSGASLSALMFDLVELELSIGDDAQAGMTGNLIVAWGMSGAIGDDGGGATADLGWQWPFIRRAYEGEQEGTVNLVLNPSLEWDARGWEALTGAVVTRDVATDAWIGDASAAMSTTGTGQLRIQCRAGLETVATQAFVGSLFIWGLSGQDVTLWLQAVYTDATTTISDPVVLTTDVMGYVLALTDSVTSDPAKVLDTLWLYVEQDGDINADGAQVEPDTGQHRTPYADGSLGAYHRWLGPPGWSPSVRDPLPMEVF